MWYTIIVTIIIQYSLGLLWKTVAVSNFGILDMFMHILFIIQSLWILFLIYMYILWDKLENLKEDNISIINLVRNLVLFLTWILISANIVSIFFMDKIKEIFNIL